MRLNGKLAVVTGADSGIGRATAEALAGEGAASTGSAACGAAKAGLPNLSRALALEVAPGRITVNNVAPGLTDTPVAAGVLRDPAKAADAAEAIPLGWAGRPREVGRLVVYLASADADYVTGQAFTIDGGLTMNWGQGAEGGPGRHEEGLRDAA